MTTLTPTSTEHVPATPVRAGLALSAVIGLSQLIYLHPDIDWGADDPGVGLILVGAAIGMVSVVCAMLAWKSGNRRLIRINVAALIVLGLSIVPGLFVDTTAFIRLSTAVTIVAIVVAVVLLMRRRHVSARVTD